MPTTSRSTSQEPARRGGRWFTGLAVSLLAAGSIGVVAPGAAQAAEPCVDQVCLFDGSGSFVSSYRDVTGHFQAFHRFRAATATNGFEDNAVYFQYRDGDGPTSCIQPKRTASLAQPEYGPVVGIMVRPGGNCYPGGEIQ